MNKKTIKKIIVFILIICICSSLCGCWDYVGLNEIAITLGVAVDKEEDNYKLTFEIVDLLESSKDTGIKTTYIEGEGKTVFEAARNAKSRTATKIFFGNQEVLVISEQIAKEEGILKTLDFFMRDAEPRETIHVMISKEKTAKDLLIAKGLTNPASSLEIKEIIRRDHEVTSKTAVIQLYQIYSILYKHGWMLVLPAFHAVKNNDISTPESDGMAVFKEDKLIGYLAPDETFFCLFVINEVNGGLFSVEKQNDLGDRTTYEITGSKTKTDFEYDKEKDKFKITVEIDIETFISQCPRHLENPYDTELINEMKKMADEYLKKNIENVIQKVQTQYNSDIFGFGNTVYRKDNKLWHEVSENWDRYFRELEVEIKPNVHIRNTALFRN